MKATRLFMFVMAAALFLTGCAEKCFSDGATVRMHLDLGPGIDGAKIKTLVLGMTLGHMVYQENIHMAGRLADGETSVEISLKDRVSGDFDLTVEVRALNSAGMLIASASGRASGGENSCEILNLTLSKTKYLDQGPPPDSSLPDISPKPDKGGDSTGPKPDKFQHLDQLPVPPDSQLDFPPIPVDMPPIPADMPPIPADLPPIPADLPPIPADMPPIPTDLPPIPPDAAKKG